MVDCIWGLLEARLPPSSSPRPDALLTGTPPNLSASPLLSPLIPSASCHARTHARRIPRGRTHGVGAAVRG